jgi:hypothetical protein
MKHVEVLVMIEPLEREKEQVRDWGCNGGLLERRSGEINGPINDLEVSGLDEAEIGCYLEMSFLTGLRWLWSLSHRAIGRTLQPPFLLLRIRDNKFWIPFGWKYERVGTEMEHQPFLKEFQCCPSRPSGDFLSLLCCEVSHAKVVQCS